MNRHKWTVADSKYDGENETGWRILIAVVLIGFGILAWVNLVAPVFK
jgi:hypothetical protein